MLAFLLSTVAISLSGVMAPGPITAATLAAGARSRHAGAMIAVGHALVEVPLIALLAFGPGAVLQSPSVRAAIGLVGGLLLILMGTQLLAGAGKSEQASAAGAGRRPLWIGVALTAANPYFLLWWATVGLTLATQAVQWGIAALGLFALVHWLCDLGWLEVLSLAGFQGSAALGRRAERMIAIGCGVVLLAFGLKFIYDAAIGLRGTI